MLKNAYVYVRVSSEEQVTNYSLANQEEYCQREAQRQSFQISNIYKEEGVSAKTLNRPALLQLLEACRINQKSISAVFIYKIDRISRDTYDFLLIKKRLAGYGIRIISVTEPVEDSPTGEFLETLLAASAKLDNATKSLRTKDGMRKRLEEGWAIGKAPVGYLNVSINNKQIIEPDPEQFQIVEKSWEEMASGIYTLDTIVPVMNKLGVKINYKGSRIPITRNQQTHRIFRDKFYAGYIVSKKFGIDTIGKHKPMVSEELFYKVQAILDKRAHKAISFQKQNVIFPLRGVLCSKCGLPMTGATSRGNGGKYSYYYCAQRKHYSPSIPKEVFEDQFIHYLRAIQPKKELVVLFSEMVKEKWVKRYSHLLDKVLHLNRGLEDLYDLRKKLGQKHLNGIYTDEVFKEQLKIIEDDITERKIMKAQVDLQSIDIEVLVKFMNNFLWNIDKAWLDGSLEERRFLLGSIFPDNVIYDYTGFRTNRLSPSFALMQQFKTTYTPLWVTDGVRTRDILLHRQVLYQLSYGHQ